MDYPSEYDIFEITADGTPVWKASVEGEEAALAEFESLAKGCQNEIILVHLSSGVVVARKAPKTKPTVAAAVPVKGSGPTNGNTPASNHQ